MDRSPALTAFIIFPRITMPVDPPLSIAMAVRDPSRAIRFACSFAVIPTRPSSGPSETTGRSCPLAVWPMAVRAERPDLARREAVRRRS